MIPRFARVVLSALALLFAHNVFAQSPASCPVVSTLASSKVNRGEMVGEHIVIWYFNQSAKPVRGVQFSLFMLDAVGNRYPAAQKYIAKGQVDADHGDVVSYETKEEEAHFGKDWQLIEGVEVRVTQVLFKDGSVWTPKKGAVCKANYMNDDYDAELDRRWKAAEERANKAKQ